MALGAVGLRIHGKHQALLSIVVLGVVGAYVGYVWGGLVPSIVIAILAVFFGAVLPRVLLQFRLVARDSPPPKWSIYAALAVVVVGSVIFGASSYNWAYVATVPLLGATLITVIAWNIGRFDTVGKMSDGCSDTEP